MDAHAIVTQLRANGTTFRSMLTDVPVPLRTWRPRPDHWCLLEIACHLRDEEREDFGARVRSVLDDPSSSLPPIDPPGWVSSRRYVEQDFESTVGAFLREREASVEWLDGLAAPDWTRAHQHPRFGPMSAGLFLASWLAHDYLHMRQITKVKYLYLGAHAGVDLQYAGTW